MKKTELKIKHLRRGAMDRNKKAITLATVDSLLDRLADIDPLREQTADEYDSTRNVLWQILMHEVPDRSDLLMTQRRTHRGF